MIEILAVYSFTKNVFYKKINYGFLVSSDLTNNRAFFHLYVNHALFLYKKMKGGIMRTKSNDFLSNFIVKQFDLTKYRALILAFIEITITIEAMLNDEYYRIRFDSGGDLKVGGIKKPISNQMESMMIRDYQTKEKMQQVLLKYKMAYNTLNDLEKDVFKLTFIDRLKDFDICDELCIYQKKLIQARNSATIRFCLYLGLDKFVNLF